MSAKHITPFSKDPLPGNDSRISDDPTAAARQHQLDTTMDAQMETNSTTA